MRVSGIFIATILIIAICSILPSGDAHQCYKCKSSENANCGIQSVKDEDWIEKETCPEVAGVGQCNKLVVEEGGEEGGIEVSRGCHTETSCTDSEGRKILKCMTCTGDLCNDSLKLVYDEE